MRRPLEAYAFGMVDRWARLGSFAPRLANFMNTAPGLSALMRRALRPGAGAPDCRASRTVNFRRWARSARVPTVGVGARATDPRSAR